MRELTLEDLTRIMREAAGDGATGLDAENADALFADLGYDSLALLETVARVEREYGLGLPDDLVVEAPTPRRFLAAVNLQARTAA